MPPVGRRRSPACDRDAGSYSSRTDHPRTPDPPGRQPVMPIATPEVYNQMLDRAKEGRFAYPSINLHVVGECERRPARVRGGRERRHHPVLHRRLGVRLRSLGEGHGGGGLGRARGVRPRRRGAVLDQHRSAHRPLPEGQARLLRPTAPRRLPGAGGPRPEPPLPVPHVGRLGRRAPREPGHRPGAAREGGEGEHHPRAGDRRRRRRGGRGRGGERRQAVHRARRLRAHRGGAGRRGEGPLPAGRHLRQRPRRLQAGQREAAPGDPQAGSGGGGRRSWVSPRAPSRSTWSSTAARARCSRRSTRPWTTAW